MSFKDKPIVATHLKKRSIRKSEAPRPGKKIIKSKALKFRRLERFLSPARAAQNNEKRIERYENKPNFVQKKTPEQKEQEKVYIVVRLTGNYGLYPALNKMFRYLRLTRKHSAVIVRATPAMDLLLAKAQQFIAWGKPDLTTVQDLLQKRGYAAGNTSKDVVPLSDNKYIEDKLGQYGIVCLEDIVHELITAGPNFNIVQQWLAPFDLEPPKGGLRVMVGNGKQPKQTEEELKLAKILGTETHNGYHSAEEMKELVKKMI